MRKLKKIRLKFSLLRNLSRVVYAINIHQSINLRGTFILKIHANHYFSRYLLSRKVTCVNRSLKICNQ